MRDGLGPRLAAGGGVPLALPAAAAALRAARIAPGWSVVAGAFLVLMVGYGAAYSFAAFAGPLAAEFGVTHARLSLVYAACGCAVFMTGAASGPLADRIGAWRPALLGMLLVGAGLLATAAARSFAALLLCYGVLIGCGIGLAYVPALAAVQRRFRRRRGLASGVAAAGIGTGMALVPPVAEALLRLEGGWRLCFLLSGLGAAGLGAAGALLLRRRPEPAPPMPDPDRAPDGSAAGAGWHGAVRRPGFPALYLGCLLVSVPMGLPMAHLVAFAGAQGMAGPEALQLLSVIGACSIGGRLLIGALADRLGRRRSFLACCWCLAGATGLWALAGDAGGLALFAVVFGLGSGGFVGLLPPVVADLYGAASAGRMIGLLYTSRGLALLLGPPLVGLAAEGAAGPLLPIGAAAVLGALGTLLMARGAARGHGGTGRTPVPRVAAAGRTPVPRVAAAGRL